MSPLLSSQFQPPRILQIYRDRLKPGSYAAYGQIERDIARACVELGFPHAYLRLIRSRLLRSTRKASLILEPVEMFANYMEDLSGGVQWSMGLGRFLVITVTGSNKQTDRTVFATSDGTRFIVSPANTRTEADANAAGSEARVFAVRPYWSMPAAEWVTADPDFWERNRSSALYHARQ